MSVLATARERMLEIDRCTPIRQAVGDLEILREVVDRLDTYLQYRPERFDHRPVNVQLHTLVQQEGRQL
jgi:hypothetical protein